MTAIPSHPSRGFGRLWLLILLAWLGGCAAPNGLSAPPSATPAPAAAVAPPAVAAAVAAASAVPAPTEAPDTTQGDGGPFNFAVDALEPSVIVDPADAATRADLWARIRAGFGIADLDGDLVAKWQDWYASRPDYVDRMTERGGRFLYHVVEELDKRGMPTDLALLPFIESAFNPRATSGARASGIWQFMPATGKDFDLTQNIFRDDRRDVLASTRAALDYLQALYGQFGDWQLALAAYNWGQGNVQRAIDRNAKAGLPTDYASLRMPDETRNYVPKLQAIKNIVLQPDRYGVQLPPLQNHPYFLSVPIRRDIDVAVAAQLANLPLDEFQMLNPQMNKPVILAAGTPQVLLPFDNAEVFLTNLRTRGTPTATWTAWVTPVTLKPADAARRVGMSEAELRRVNHIPPRKLIKAGSTLLVPRTAERMGNVPEAVADNATMRFAPEVTPGRRITFKAGKHGDSVAAVAKRYRVGVAQVAQWNSVSGNAHFKPGQIIVVVQSAPPKGKRLSRAPTKRVVSAPKASHRTTRTASSPSKPHTSTAKASQAPKHVTAEASSGRADSGG